MKLTRKIMAIAGIVVSGFILFQSCAVGVANSLKNNGSSSGTGGVLLVIFMLIAAILSLTSHNNKSVIISGVFFMLGGFIGLGFGTTGTFSDLTIWGIMNVIFGLFYLISGIIEA